MFAARARLKKGEVYDGGWWAHGGHDESEAEWWAEDDNEAALERRRAEEKREGLTCSMNSTAPAIPLLASHWAHKYQRTPEQAERARRQRMDRLGLLC